MNRRQFLQTGASGLAFAALGGLSPLHAAAAPKRVGLIGTGWYGKCDLWRLLQVAPCEIVSLCDVDRRMLAQAADIAEAKQKKRPRTYADYREMLKERDLDLVLIATPDHWHALPAIAAIQAGADLYLQKPVSVDIVEGQAILAAARKHGRVVQIGTQRRSTPHLVQAREDVIKAGLLGKVGHVDICCYWHMRANGNPPDIQPPESLDYEMWTGPAPMRPFNQWVHPRGWRAFMEYSNGIVGDMGVHMLDMVRWMLDLGWPTSVSSTGGIRVQKSSKANTTDTQTATFDFDGLPVVWTHRTWGASGETNPDYQWSATLYGDKGTLKASVFKYDYTPQGSGAKPLSGTPLFEYEKYPEDKEERDLEKHCASAIRRHMVNLLDASETRGRPVADIEQGHISTTSCILANLSQKLGRSLQWDAANHRIAGDDEANRLMRRPYRAPWVHPEPGQV